MLNGIAVCSGLTVLNRMENSLSTEDLNFTSRFIRNLNDIHEKHELCDVSLESRDLYKVPCHGVILAAISHSFKEVLNKTEDVTAHEASPLDIYCQYLDKPTLDLFVSFLYDGKIELTLQNVQPLANTGVEFHIPALQEFCESYMLAHVNVDNCFSYSTFAKDHNFRKLQHHTDMFKAKYFTDLVKHESFLQLDEEHLKALLTDDELLIQSEDAVLLAAIAWLEANISHESTHAFSELIEDVLRCVRFEFCTTWKMYRLLMNDGFARSISTSLHGPMLMACMCKFAPDDQKIDILWRNDRAVTGKNMISLYEEFSPPHGHKDAHLYVSPDYSEYLLARLYALKLEGLYSDVELLSSDGDNMKCHRVVLAAGWQYFRAMFTTNLSESQSKVVGLPSMDSTTIVCIINHVYNFKTILSRDNVRNLLHTCHMLEVDDLTKDCERYMLDDIDIGNCIEYYQDAALFQLIRLERKAKRYILCKYEQVSSTECFLSLTGKELVDLISSDYLTVDNETIVFNSVAKWMEFNKPDADDQLYIFQHIRFIHLSSEYLVSLLEHPLISNTDQQKYIQSALEYHKNNEGAKNNTNQSSLKTSRTGLLNEKLITITKDKHIVALSVDTVDDVYDKKRPVGMIGDMTSTFCVTPTGIMICGGQGIRNCVTYDLKNDTLARYTDMLSERWGHAAAVDVEHLYVVGGYDGRRTLNSLHSLHLKQKTWKVLSPMKKAVNWPLMVSHKDNLYVIGGTDLATALQIYTKSTDKWNFGSDMPRACDSAKGGIVLHNGMIHTVCHKFCMTYTLATDTWATMVYDRIGDHISQPIVYQGLVTVFSMTRDDFKLMSLDVNKSSWTEKKRIKSDRQMVYVSPWNYIIQPFLCVKCPPVM